MCLSGCALDASLPQRRDNVEHEKSRPPFCPLWQSTASETWSMCVGVEGLMHKSIVRFSIHENRSLILLLSTPVSQKGTVWLADAPPLSPSAARMRNAVRYRA